MDSAVSFTQEARKVLLLTEDNVGSVVARGETVSTIVLSSPKNELSRPHPTW